jgi:hypothetical protein
VPWETMEQMTPAMPVIRGIIDMFETRINPYRRGKSHTTPEIEQDIKKLSGCFIRDKVFKRIPGRKFKDNGEDTKKTIPTDHIQKGSELLRKGDWLAKWAEGRDVDRGTEEYWDPSPENSDVEGLEGEGEESDAEDI